MDDVLREFLTESNENVVRLEHEILELERAPTNAELLNSIFRTVHTIKGTCGFLGLRRLERVTHACESILSRVRDGRLDVSRPLMTSVLEAVDVIRNIVASLEHDGAEPPGDDDALIATLESLSTTERLDEAQTSLDASVASAVDQGVPTGASSPAAAVRVSPHILEQLDQLTNELLHGAQELAQTAPVSNGPLVARVNRLNLTIADLAQAVRRARMQPIGEVWRRLPRVVRDLAQETGKRIELDLIGAETEVDRQVLQALQDAFMHMVRNCADHGIESPDERLKAGKPECGRITLAARQAVAGVVIDVIDDGAGLDVSKIRSKAVERRLLSRDVAADLSDDEALRLIFQPGFSTADHVTNVSGRGVGMDVVYTNIAQIGGVVELSTHRGVGTTIRLRVPIRVSEPR